MENMPLANTAHERFAQNIASGMPAKEAYLDVFRNCKKKSALKSASRLLHRPEIIERLSFLKRKNADISMWDRADSMEILRSIAENEEKRDCDRINAVNILNQMCGYSEPKQTQVTTTIFQFISPDRGIKEESHE